MERDYQFCAGLTRDVARLPRGEMMLSGGMIGILVEKYAFDEKLRRVRRQRRDALYIVLVKSDVGHVADLLAWHQPQYLGPERSQRENAFVFAVAVVPPGAHRCLVGCVSRHRILEFLQPWPDRKPKFGKPVLPHVDVSLLLDREPEAGSAVVEKRGADAERRLIEKHAVMHAPRLKRLALKAIVAAQSCAAGMPSGIDLPDIDHKVAGIVLDQVPGVGGELVSD